MTTYFARDCLKCTPVTPSPGHGPALPTNLIPAVLAIASENSCLCIIPEIFAQKPAYISPPPLGISPCSQRSFFTLRHLLTHRSDRCPLFNFSITDSCMAVALLADILAILGFYHHEHHYTFICVPLHRKDYEMHSWKQNCWVKVHTFRCG